MEEQKTKKTLMMVMCIFGTVGIFVNYIKLPTSLIAVVRGSLGAIFLFSMTKFKKEKISIKGIKTNWKMLFFSGALIGLNWIFLFEAYKYTTVAIATLCSYLAPVFMMLASHFILKEKLSKINVICISVALLGMLFVSGVLESKELAAGNFRGIFFGLMTALCYACVVFMNKFIKGVKANDMTIVQLAVAALALLPYTLISGSVSNIEFDFVSIIFLLIISTLHTGYSYAVYFECVGKLKTQTVAIYSYIDPIVAIVFSAIILKQRMTFLSMVGAVLILGSTLFSELMEKKRKI
ncbi:DMT family transporter [Fusobacterium russii]|uniref:DMT family transporter n=1 Tax=Fusobacterium russii TaxID=854 RepID=UPI0003AB0E93|nr:DMT family transporter [Fusobacterium russii]